MNLWYLFVGIGFVGAGIYKIMSSGFAAGVIWIIIGVLFGFLARTNHKKKR